MADSAAPLPENPAVATNSQQPPSESDNKTSQSDPSPAVPPPPTPSIHPYSAVPPSFRPATPPAPVPGSVSGGGGVTPMFSPLPNPNLQSNFPNPSVQPPGVSSMPPAMIPAPNAPQIMQPYGGQMMRPYVHMPNGYPAMLQPPPQGAMLHPVS